MSEQPAQQLARFAGRWLMEGQGHESPFVPAASWRATDDIEWLEGGQYLVRRFHGKMGEQEVACIEILGHKDGQYFAHTYYNDGNFHEWQITERDGAWIFDSTQKGQDGRPRKVRCTTTFTDAGRTRLGHWEWSEDGEQWSVFLEAKATRV
jgi:hypothetical protein